MADSSDSRSLRFTIKMVSDTLVNANLKLKDDLATIMEKVNPLLFYVFYKKTVLALYFENSKYVNISAEGC